MPNELEIKKEMMDYFPSDEIRKICEPELDLFIKTDNLDGKPIIQKLYSQWKSGKKGNKNKANFWSCYHLGITSKKPDIDKPIFPKRRAFARPSPPDIDSDFDYNRRDEIMAYIVKRYGRYNVGNIGTYGALKMRSCLTRLIKALDIANAWKIDPKTGKADTAEYTTRNVEKVNEILSTLPQQHGAILKVNDENGDEVTIKTTRDVVEVNSAACDDFREYMERYPDIYKGANQLEGLLSIFSVHASGVVISDEPLHNIAPLRTAKDTGGTVSYATQFAYEDLETLGLIKFDVLAISTLTVIAETLKNIKDNYGIEIDIENLPLDPNVSQEAKNTYDLYQSGKLVGVFQCESTGMQKTCQEVGIDRFEDIMAVISLYRPGPMESIPRYIARKHGKEAISYFHPSIEPHVSKFLGETYGVATYQEQLMRICEHLAGMSLGDGYVVIKGVGKKKLDIIAKNKGIFVAGCVANGVPEKVADEYWEKFLVPFANYGFNKSHSCCYAYNSYITAYLKANFPEEFMLAYLNVETGRKKWDRVDELEAECHRMGMNVLPRDINKSGLYWKINKKKDISNGIPQSEIRPPIYCKGLTFSAAQEIVEKSPYQSVKEFAIKTNPSMVDSDSVESLCDAKFFKTKKDKLVSEFKNARNDMKSLKSRGRVSQNIFGD